MILAPVGLLGQEDDEKEEEDVYEISPFVVQEEQNTGYIATSTLAGTRLRSSLQDIGASVQVITTEFLDDIGATESTDLLLFTTATETAGLGGNFSGGEARQDDRVVVGGVLSNPQGANRVRGLGAPDNTRDFFLTDIPFDSFNTGRVEINRGANAILFGLGSPSGVLNAGLNRAIF
ncbi:MAG: TonB-dependent receptor plug domain-containing protein, partial [Verrucomicrobiae bacterium]|nr:TonB-dependent receptor plug domain-containing protein [Verrucomicrobiae bacterium]